MDANERESGFYRRPEVLTADYSDGMDEEIHDMDSGRTKDWKNIERPTKAFSPKIS